MNAIDTSALMTIVLDEPDAASCIDVLEAEDDIVISAATVAEALIVAGRRNVEPEVRRLIDGLGFEIVDVTSATALRVAEIHARWGKGIHRAALNFGDCFAYDLARERGCPLLFVGNDFAQTDIERAG
ncbi:type II toxin-antitoxin system VapC family toxin [Sphingomonas sp. MG17]|uniref:Ribonuclease VapC n=1 Tax=Sphingomonas tagetis TaxID=2949092 RepID=A0A9X2HRK2_9SPHN|nr:type II toxin-antitoxin system VapC family toxin [Sphingomonas tagetis]MCP3731300.1 type II toxin-antitoxin system VapC family toxin [Sphingomonas tagetis]